MSRYTQTLEYDFEHHMNEPVKIRLVNDFEDEYAMEFCLLNETPRWHGPSWHQVQTYVCALRGTEPGTGLSTGVWTTRWFEVRDADHAKKILENYREKIKTVGDIYRLFIENSIRERERDMEAYKKYKSHLDSLPNCVE